MAATWNPYKVHDAGKRQPGVTLVPTLPGLRSAPGYWMWQASDLGIVSPELGDEPEKSYPTPTLLGYTGVTFGRFRAVIRQPHDAPTKAPSANSRAHNRHFGYDAGKLPNAVDHIPTMFVVTCAYDARAQLASSDDAPVSAPDSPGAILHYQYDATCGTAAAFQEL